MAIKKYFLDSKQVNGEWVPKYGADDLNKVVGYLRTTGVFGEIADCLKVSEGTGTTVNIANGIGWVDGCGIEATDKDTTLVLPTVSGTYKVYMKLDKSSDVVNDISFAYSLGDIPANQVLALVTVLSGAITAVDSTVRVNSQFRGETQLPGIFVAKRDELGKVTYELLGSHDEEAAYQFPITTSTQAARSYDFPSVTITPTNKKKFLKITFDRFSYVIGSGGSPPAAYFRLINDNTNEILGDFYTNRNYYEAKECTAVVAFKANESVSFHFRVGHEATNNPDVRFTMKYKNLKIYTEESEEI